MTARYALENGLSQLGLQVYPQAVDKLVDFCDRLLEKNKVMNLTGATTMEEVVSRHLLDCAAAYASFSFAGKSVVDVGCGAGFPGVPLSVLFPEAQLTLLDSLQKRILFLQDCAAAIPLENITAVHERAETFAGLHREGFDCAVSRAVADLRVLCELCLPLVRVGGIFAPMKSTGSDEELTAAQKAVALLGGEVEDVRNYEIPETGVFQRVVTIRKIRETPAQYPRRFAKISARPL